MNETTMIEEGVVDAAASVKTKIPRVRKPVDVAAFVAAQDGVDAGVQEADAANREEELQLCVEAAWKFGKSVLWKDHAEDEEEQRKVMGMLEDFFRTAADSHEAFVQFVARVMKAEANKKRCPILRPLRWLLQAQEDGLLKPVVDVAALGGVLKVTKIGRVAEVLAKHFLDFVREPSVKTFLRCSEELEGVGGKGWMRVFFG